MSTTRATERGILGAAEAAECLHMTAAMPHIEGVQVFATSTYERAIRKLLGEEARREMEDSIVAAPDAAPVIRGTGGIRKLRWAGSGRGKRGGIRAVFYQAGPDAIYLLTAYAKAEREDLTPADTEALTRLVAAIKKELQGK
ncbi:MAG: type II toxin-antitoxin system RelE/ParE family toxin [Chloroflexota bacterium]|nr:type II toxin-antitoxin system RelE/ParE family toxin [Chloroflexota bacterium]